MTLQNVLEGIFKAEKHSCLMIADFSRKCQILKQILFKNGL